MFAVHRDPETCAHNPSDALARFEEAGALYQRWDGQWQRYRYGYWVVRRHGSAQQLGFCGIKPMVGAPVLNHFHRFATSARGQGFAGEAAAAVATWASHHLPDRGIRRLRLDLHGPTSEQGHKRARSHTRTPRSERSSPEWLLTGHHPDQADSRTTRPVRRMSCVSGGASGVPISRLSSRAISRDGM
ncbi:GNAT family N-acetyltransferase [Streptomyces sp. NPDC058818]|uniref:GNAT family N-acetyltransferase n=1 Tax=Streptomyces sp. NPDC058818 TaxID=3346640 RepID=UPI0036859583